jgi:CRISPR-associated endonuclease Csn1
LVDINNLSKEQAKRVYKMVSSTKFQCFFVFSTFSIAIVDKTELGPLNKLEKSIEGHMIKENCWKLETNRLGEIKKIHR